MRRRRDGCRRNASLDQPRAAAHSRSELLPAFMEYARSHAAVGEQVGVLKKVYGVYRDPGYY